MRRGDLVLDHVPLSSLPEVLGRTSRSSDTPVRSSPYHPQLASRSFRGAAVQARKHLAHALAMNPFFPFDLLNCGVLVRVLYDFQCRDMRTGGKLARVGSLKNVMS